MKVLVAPDKFKLSLSAAEAAEAMRLGVLDAAPGAEVLILPVADGGEGTLDTLLNAAPGRTLRRTVTGPLGEPVEARFGLLPDGAAVVELAEAAGYRLVPEAARNPTRTTTRGVGELMLAALDEDAASLLVAIGGSATNDGGAGMLQGVGARLLDADGRDIPLGGGGLARLEHADLSTIDPRLRRVPIRVACDVNNSLTGPRGASAVYGPQKGATPAMVELLDANLRRFARVLRRDAAIDVEFTPGAGAAGGIGAGLLALGARLVPGADLVLDAIGFDAALQSADLVLTGEGRIDEQTPSGKVVAAVVARAGRARVAVHAFAGRVEPGFEALYALGLAGAHEVSPRGTPIETALRDAAANLRRRVADVARSLAP